MCELRLCGQLQSGEGSILSQQNSGNYIEKYMEIPHIWG